MGVGASGWRISGNDGFNRPEPNYMLHPADGVLMEICPELMVIVLQFLTASEAHAVAAMPLCQMHSAQISSNYEFWITLCSDMPWRLPAKRVCEFRTGPEARAAHRGMVAALQTVERSGTVQGVLKPMALFRDVVGLQLACLRALVPMLEYPSNRETAQASGLTSLVVCAMGEFSADVELQLAALRTLLLLARPIGGSEGSLFARSMASPPDLDVLLRECGGIATVLATMARNLAVAEVQAMACWALVNVMLIPAQKVLVAERGGVRAVLEAMRVHPCDFEVQHRALFALINLLVPDGAPPRPAYDEVIPFVLGAMEKFERHEVLVNCGCLVLHNLVLLEVYRSASAGSIAVGCESPVSSSPPRPNGVDCTLHPVPCVRCGSVVEAKLGTAGVASRTCPALTPHLSLALSLSLSLALSRSLSLSPALSQMMPAAAFSSTTVVRSRTTRSSSRGTRRSCSRRCCGYTRRSLPCRRGRSASSTACA